MERFIMTLLQYLQQQRQQQQQSGQGEQVLMTNSSLTTLLCHHHHSHPTNSHPTNSPGSNHQHSQNSIQMELNPAYPEFLSMLHSLLAQRPDQQQLASEILNKRKAVDELKTWQLQSFQYSNVLQQLDSSNDNKVALLEQFPTLLEEPTSESPTSPSEQVQPDLYFHSTATAAELLTGLSSSASSTSTSLPANTNKPHGFDGELKQLKRSRDEYSGVGTEGDEGIREWEKRRRNTLASARHRAKKKSRELEIAKQAAEQTERANLLQERVHQLESEVKYLKGLLLELNTAAAARLHS